MNLRFLSLAGSAVVAWIGASPVQAAEVVHVAPGSTWRYFRGLSEASSPDAAAWRAVGFNDAAWLIGAAPFGYGDPPFGTDLSAPPPMLGNYSSVFLRRGFVIARAADVVALEATVDYDDGFIVWINGVEVLRQNVTDNPPAASTLASVGHESGTYETFELPDPSVYVRAGENVVAVMVFNQSISSSDAKLDLALVDPVGPDLSPPVMSGLAPSAGARIRSLSRIDVTFSEAVSGVDAQDLRVAGLPALSIGGSGAGPYTFLFPEQPDGLVGIDWIAGNGISDLASPANAFAGGAWSYTVDSKLSVPQLLVSELLASNASGLVDEDGDRGDWIEVYNAGPGVVDLGGYALTDDADEPGKFVLPARTLGPEQYLVVFASGKDRRPAAGNIHANFSLAASGEHLGLYSPDAPRLLVHGFAPAFPEQRGDISYGVGSGGGPVYFAVATPGAPNGAGAVFSAVVAPVEPSAPRGFYAGPFFLSLVTPTAGADVYYTLDGSEPSPTSGTRYLAPFEVRGTARKAVVAVRAAAFQPGLLPSRVTTFTFVFPDLVLSQPANPDGFPATWGNALTISGDYELDPQVFASAPVRARAFEGLLDIPTLSIVTTIPALWDRTSGIYMNGSQEGIAWERPVSAELIHADGSEGFQVDCGLRVQGGSSTDPWKAAKLSLRLLFKGDYGAAKLRARVFDDSAVESFDTLVLDAHLNLTFLHPSHDQRVRSQYCRDELASDLQLATGNPAPHSRFVNLYLNGLHWGLYSLHERPSADFQAEYLGGAKAEYDTLRHTGSQVVEGTLAAWNSMATAARAGLADNSAYANLQGSLDVPGLVDYMLVNLWAGNDDWPHHNWYAGRRRSPDGLFRFYSWDAEHVLKSATINQTGVNNANSPAELFSLLRANAEFRLLVADHVERHFAEGGMLHVDASSPAWDPARPERNRPAQIYMRRIREIDDAMVLEAARWGDNRREPPYTRENEWSAELNWLLTQYFPVRSPNVLAQLRSASLYPSIGAPVLARRGGIVVPGFELALSRPAGTSGTIYVTTGGADPRVFGSGAPAPGAVAYAAPIVIPSGTLVRARIQNGSTWSALAEAFFSVPDAYAGLRITELMYNAAAGPTREWVELKNAGSTAIDVSWLSFSAGVEYEFPAGVVLAPGAFWVLAADAAAFAALYGLSADGVFSGSLDNSGERLEVSDAAGAVVLALEYDDGAPWPLGPDGFGFSLVPRDLSEPALGPTAFRASAELLGSPRADDAAPRHDGVLVSEILAASAPPLEDAIEISNPTPVDADVSGWFLSDSRADFSALRKFRIPAGTVLPPGGYAVFYEHDLNDSPGAPSSFALDSGGDDVYLAAADPATGDLTGHITGFEIPVSEPGVSYGLVVTAGGPRYSALAARTFGVDEPSSVEDFRGGAGLPNAPPLVGPVVIHEVHYHPAAGPPAGSEVEFIELRNVSAVPVQLHDDSLGKGFEIAGVSRVQGVGAFELPPGAEIPPLGYALIVPVDPSFYRQRRGIAAAVPIWGPAAGALDNGGERLELRAPFREPGGAVAMATVDQVSFDDYLPWPEAADGGGPSLERRDATAYGDDAANWGASMPVGGTPGATNSIGSPLPNLPPVPRFTWAPETGAAPLDVSLDASASSDADGTIVSFRWTFGDGAVGSGRVAPHRYAAAGSFVVRLSVTDDRGAAAALDRTIVIRGANIGPTASFTASPTEGDAPLAVALDASASFDPDGEIAHYSWELGDGGRGSSPEIAHTFLDPGAYLVRLVVTDDSGATASAVRTIEVSAVSAGGGQVPGDCNQDGVLDISDGICVLGHLFLGRPAELPCAGGTIGDAGNRALLNLNGDAAVDLTDAVYVLTFLFRGGAPPVLGTRCVVIEECPQRCTP